MKPPRHFRFLSIVLSVCSALLLTGCFDTKQEFTINPDGSGKVIHESTFQKLTFSDESKDPADSLKEAVSKVIQDSKGVDAWKDVTFETLEDGRIHFKGTAYFKDLSKLKLDNQQFQQFQFGWQKGAGDTHTLTELSAKSDAPSASTKQSELAALSPEARAKKIKEERGKFQQMKPMMAGVIGTMRQAVVFHLPGKVGAVANFQKDAKGDLSLLVEGAKLMAAMEKLINDDEWLIQSGGMKVGNDSAPTMDLKMNALIFGTNAPISATVSGATKPLFDYEAEKAAALKALPALQKQLGGGAVGAVSLAPPAQGGALKSLKVVGVQLVTGGDQKREIQPFNQFESGYNVALLGEFPGSVLAVTGESVLEKAIASDGADLLPESEFKRKIHFPRLSKEKSGVLFELELKAPAAGVKGIKELSGQLQYTVADISKEVDLGFSKLEVGATGTQLGAKVEKIEKAFGDDTGQQITIKLNGRPEIIKSVSLVVNGQKTPLKQNGYSGGGNSFSYPFTHTAAIPANGRLVADIFDEVKTFKVPFKLENITLLGMPMEPGK